MKAVPSNGGKLVRTLALAAAILTLPASVGYAQHGASGGNANWGGSAISAHHGHQHFSGGYGWGVGGYYPGSGWGYGSLYGYGDYFGYGVSDGSVGVNPYYGVYAPSPYYGVYAPFSGVSPFAPSTAHGGLNFTGLFP